MPKYKVVFVTECVYESEVEAATEREAQTIAKAYWRDSVKVSETLLYVRDAQELAEERPE